MSKIIKSKINTKYKKFNSDRLLVFVAIFGVIGSIVIFRSYANRSQEISLSKAYQLSEIESSTKSGNISAQIINEQSIVYIENNGSITYTVLAYKDARYCLWGWADPGTYVSLSLNETAISQFQPDNSLPPLDSKELICITNQSGQSDKVLKIEIKGNAWLDKIVVE